MEIRKNEGVIYIHKITKGGPYDLLLKINGLDRNELGITSRYIQTYIWFD